MKPKHILANSVILLLAACEATPTLTAPAVNQPLEQTYHSGGTDGVSLELIMQRRVRLHAPIYVDFTLRNGTENTIVLNHDTTEGDIRMRLVDRLGRPVSVTDLGKRLSGDPYQFTRNLQLYVTPGSTMHWRYDLLDYFQIDTPGFFRLSVLRTIDGREPGPITSRGQRGRESLIRVALWTVPWYCSRRSIDHQRLPTPLYCPEGRS